MPVGPWVQLCGFAPWGPSVIICISTGDDSCVKDVIPDVPLLNLLPFLAKPNESVHGSVKCLFGTPPEGQLPLLVWILLAPGLGDV